MLKEYENKKIEKKGYDLAKQYDPYFLYECVEKTITVDFQQELAFFANYDKIKLLCKEVVDMPDQRIDLFIKCIRQNGGKLSSKKREKYFRMLTDNEIKKMEDRVMSQEEK